MAEDWGGRGWQGLQASHTAGGGGGAVDKVSITQPLGMRGCGRRHRGPILTLHPCPMQYEFAIPPTKGGGILFCPLTLGGAA